MKKIFCLLLLLVPLLFGVSFAHEKESMPGSPYPDCYSAIDGENVKKDTGLKAPELSSLASLGSHMLTDSKLKSCDSCHNKELKKSSESSSSLGEYGKKKFIAIGSNKLLFFGITGKSFLEKNT